MSAKSLLTASRAVEQTVRMRLTMILQRDAPKYRRVFLQRMDGVYPRCNLLVSRRFLE